jgi:hypothetical protein
MDNKEFLKVVGESFKKFIETGSRSNEKLKILHGAIANDLKQRLGTGFSVCSLGIGDSKEMKIEGRYIDKAVDITILKNESPIAGIGVKFVMQNYSQNSNNYFENMLGETANIRCANIPYFQIFIIPDKLPYYKNDGSIQKWEEFSLHNSEKYLILSRDDIHSSIHTPTKTLLFVIHLPEIVGHVRDRQEYVCHYSQCDDMCVSESSMRYGSFSSAVVYNDYEDFAEKVVHYVKFL